MSDIYDPQQPLDPRLKALLDSLRETPPRDPEAAARVRAKYLAEVDRLFSEPTRPIASRHLHLSVEARHPKSWLGLASLKSRLAITTLLVSIAIVLLLFGGAGATAYAAQSALPGDTLYSLKTSLEDTQLRLSRDAARQAQLNLNFAERRLDEIASLIAEGRFEDIGTATDEFEAHVQQAINALETISAGDPQGANALAVQISSALSRYAQVLRGMLTEVPETVKPVMEKAILTSEEESREVEFSGTIESLAPDGIQINGKFVKISDFTEIKGAIAVGAVVKVHALEDANGALIASEIEVTAGVGGDANENANVNENEADDNLNENEDGINDNQAGDDLDENEAGDNQNEGDDNANLNENENDNEDENANQNLNENDNDENDNTGSNLNENDNHDDDHENDNDSGEHENDNSGGSENNNEIDD